MPRPSTRTIWSTTRPSTPLSEALTSFWRRVSCLRILRRCKSLYQATDIVGEMIRDLNLMLTDGNEEDMTFLTRVE